MDSNPRPSESQSDDIGCHGLLRVVIPAYPSRFSCWRLPTVAACCALGGVSSGVRRRWITHRPYLQTRPTSRHLRLARCARRMRTGFPQPGKFTLDGFRRLHYKGSIRHSDPASRVLLH